MDTDAQTAGSSERAPRDEATAPVTVVLVEDHASLAAELRGLLTARGLQVLGVAGSVAEGVALIGEQRPRVAVVDNGLPDGSGVDLCRQVSTLAPDTILLLHIGMLLTRDDEERVRQAGIAEVVLKSVSGGPLLTAIEQHVRAGR